METVRLWAIPVREAKGAAPGVYSGTITHSAA